MKNSAWKLVWEWEQMTFFIFQKGNPLLYIFIFMPPSKAALRLFLCLLVIKNVHIPDETNTSNMLKCEFVSVCVGMRVCDVAPKEVKEKIRCLLYWLMEFKLLVYNHITEVDI